MLSGAGIESQLVWKSQGSLLESRNVRFVLPHRHRRRAQTVVRDQNEDLASGCRCGRAQSQVMSRRLETQPPFLLQVSSKFWRAELHGWTDHCPSGTRGMEGMASQEPPGLALCRLRDRPLGGREEVRLYPSLDLNRRRPVPRGCLP